MNKKILLAIISLTLAACETIPLKQTFADEKNTDKWATQSNEERVAAFIYNESDSIFSIVCYYDSACIALLSNGEFCEQDAQIPVLINTKSASMSAPFSSCINPNQDEQGTGLLSFKLDQLPEGFLKGGELSFLTPMYDTQFKVSRFTLNGARDAMDTVVQKWRSNKKTEERNFTDKVF